MTNRELEFHEDHNISRTKFAKLVGVAPVAVKGYFENTLTIRENREEWLRVDIGVQIIEDYKMQFPVGKEVTKYMVGWETLTDVIKRYDDYFLKLFKEILKAEL